MNDVSEPATETTGKHRRTDQNVLMPLRQYEELLVLLHTHNPGKRSGLCLRCGMFWPCPAVTNWHPWWEDECLPPSSSAPNGMTNNDPELDADEKNSQQATSDQQMD